MENEQRQATLDYLRRCRERKEQRKKQKGPHLSVKLRSDVGKSIPEAFPKETKILATKIRQLLPPTKNFTDTTNFKLAEAAARHLMGDTQEIAAEKMGISYGKISALFAQKSPIREKMDEMLETVLLANAHIASAVFAEKAQGLTARDAAVAAGIFSSRYLEKKLERENKGKPQINISTIVLLQQTLDRVDKAKPIIDIN